MNDAGSLEGVLIHDGDCPFFAAASALCRFPRSA
jgi:hypothetical protein